MVQRSHLIRRQTLRMYDNSYGISTRDRVCLQTLALLLKEVRSGVLHVFHNLMRPTESPIHGSNFISGSTDLKLVRVPYWNVIVF